MNLLALSIESGKENEEKEEKAELLYGIENAVGRGVKLYRMYGRVWIFLVTKMVHL